MPGRLKTVTLGCKVNQYETQYVRELLFANGYREADRDEPAALAVVNTCTVTLDSDRKSRQLVRQVHKANPGAKIIVMGCYATAEPGTVRSLPGVAAVVTDKRDLGAALAPFGVQRVADGIRTFRGRRRPIVKVQDGCILDCTFCIIPKVRPGLTSRPVETIVEEVRALAGAGFREIVLTGIHLGHYGVDLSLGKPRRDWTRLWHLLKRLANCPEAFRLRLSSLEATEVTDDFVRVLADHSERICPHLHLSMQSGSDRVLAAMKRRYRIGRFLERCERLRERLDQPAFTTDVIVGFPGETDEDFRETVRACEEAGFSRIHVFSYSPRRGTEAARRADAVRPEVIAARRLEIEDVERRLAQRYHRLLLGRRLDMLVESPDPRRPGYMRGTACRYAPLRLRTLAGLAGKIVPVQATRRIDDGLEVEPFLPADGLDPVESQVSADS